MNKIALISDIHGNAVALEAVFRDVDRQKMDEVFVLGDIANRGSEPAKCVALTRSLPTVGGNGDQYVVKGYEENQKLEALPAPAHRIAPNWLSDEVRRIERRWTASKMADDDVEYLRGLPDWNLYPVINGQHMLLCHSTPTDRLTRIFSDSSNDLLYQTYIKPYPNVRIAVSGHTHRPFVRFINHAAIINAGTVGLPIDGSPAASYALVEIDEAVSASIRRVPYDVSKACDILMQVGYPYAEFLGQWLQTGMQPATPPTVASHGKSD